jgi:uncharacterized protein (TIGR00288 family)
LTPWWLRPTAEGASNEEKKPTPLPVTPPPAETPASVSSAPEPLNETSPALAPEPAWHPEPEAPPMAFFAPEPETSSPFLESEPLPAEEHGDEADDEEDEEDDDEELLAGDIGDIGEAGEAGTGAAESTEEARGERRRRPRRGRSRRGGKNGHAREGRAAGAPAETAPAEEEDAEPFREEPAEEPARRVVAMPSISPRAARSSESYVIPGDMEPLGREIIISVPERQRLGDERKIAMFCDLENIALGVRDSEISKFDIELILERLLEKGKIIVKKAYADWERYSEYKRPFHEAAIELIDIPQKYYSGKNSADIKMVVDAMDLSYSKEHLDTFVLLSGDSDFSPLVSKLKENNKYVIGVGVKNSSSALLIDNCDEFIYYEDLWRDSQKGPKLDGLNKKTAEAFSLMIDAIQALTRENKDVLWGSMIKQTMQRKKPSFNEGYYGYPSFSELLEDAERKNIIRLKKDQRSGTYIVTGFAKGSEAVPASRR